MKSLIVSTLALLVSTSLFATASNGHQNEGKPDFTCTSKAVGEWDYQFTINVSDEVLEVLQQSTNARYAPLVESIVKLEVAGDLPSAEPKYTCVYAPKSKMKYRATIKVFAESVVVLQSSKNARYAPIQYDIVREVPGEVEPEAPSAPLYSCTSEATGEWQYNFTLSVSETLLEIRQSSMVARYRPLLQVIAAASPTAEFPVGEPKFRCNYADPESKFGYNHTIEVYEDSVLVLRSSINARFSPLKFDILSGAE